MNDYALQNDGDGLERALWSYFIKDEFPSYGEFWKIHVVPLTNRPGDIHFKSDSELSVIGKSGNDICIAQLHYSILRHLSRVFEILQKDSLNPDDLVDGMTRICGSIDIAFELLERFENPSQYDPWLAKKNKNEVTEGSKEAKESWQRKNGYPLQKLRNYRNHLVHGRMLPAGLDGSTFYLPRIGLEEKYFDWRRVTNGGANRSDFLPVKDILFGAWKETLDYLENAWKKELLS